MQITIEGAGAKKFAENLIAIIAGRGVSRFGDGSAQLQLAGVAGHLDAATLQHLIQILRDTVPPDVQKTAADPDPTKELTNLAAATRDENVLADVLHQAVAAAEAASKKARGSDDDEAKVAQFAEAHAAELARVGMTPQQFIARQAELRKLGYYFDPERGGASLRKKADEELQAARVRAGQRAPRYATT